MNVINSAINEAPVSVAQWQIPSALTHATWQAAYADCRHAIERNQFSSGIELDWQACRQVDSSALAFVFDLKRSSAMTVSHKAVPAQLSQLAKLYEVDQMLGLSV